MIVYLENPKETKQQNKTRKISEFSKFAKGKNNRQKSITLLHTKNVHLKTKIKSTMSFIEISPKLNT